MKHLLLVLALVASNALADNVYVRTDRFGSLFLTDEACTQKDIATMLPAEVVAQAKRWYLLMTLEGKKTSGLEDLEGCYIVEDVLLHWINQFGHTGTDDIRSFDALKPKGF